MKGHWITKENKPNFSLDFFDVIRHCRCDFGEGFVANEDTQQVYRCALCGAPFEFAHPMEPSFDLKLLFKLDNHHVGEERHFTYTEI